MLDPRKPITGGRIGYSHIDRASLARKQMRAQAGMPCRYRVLQLFSGSGDFAREWKRCRNRSGANAFGARERVGRGEFTPTYRASGACDYGSRPTRAPLPNAIALGSVQPWSNARRRKRLMLRVATWPPCGNAPASRARRFWRAFRMGAIARRR